jgi:hypothetical protein
LAKLEDYSPNLGAMQGYSTPLSTTLVELSYFGAYCSLLPRQAVSATSRLTSHTQIALHSFSFDLISIASYCARHNSSRSLHSIMALSGRGSLITPTTQSTSVNIATWFLASTFLIMYLSRQVVKFVMLRKFQVDDYMMTAGVVSSTSTTNVS